MPTSKKPPHIYLLSEVNVTNASGDAPRQFSGIANSGKPFNHYGTRIIVDFKDIQFHDNVPALLEHERSKRAGFGKLSVENNQLMIKGTLLDNEWGNEIASDADAGFPWQMSAHVIAGSEDTLAEGESQVVNGQTVTAPIIILRKCKIPEVSFTPTGVDDETSAVILGDDGTNQGANHLSNSQNPQKDNTMTLDEALAKIKELEAMEAEKAQRIKELEDENAKLKAAENKAVVDAQLSQAGFTKSDDGKWQGVSETTYQVLLSQSADNAKAMIGDLKLSQGNQSSATTPARPTLPSVLLGEQYPTGQTQGTQLSDNPLVANAQARATGNKGYI